jgi:hypothetical protein
VSVIWFILSGIRPWYGRVRSYRVQGTVGSDFPHPRHLTPWISLESGYFRAKLITHVTCTSYSWFPPSAVVLKLRLVHNKNNHPLPGSANPPKIYPGNKIDTK